MLHQGITTSLTDSDMNGVTSSFRDMSEVVLKLKALVGFDAVYANHLKFFLCNLFSSYNSPFDYQPQT